MTYGEVDCGILLIFCLFAFFALRLIYRIVPLVDFFEFYRTSQSVMAHLDKYSTAFSDSADVLLRKHVEEFILTVPPASGESGIPLKQIRVEDNTAGRIFQSVDVNKLNRFLFPDLNSSQHGRLYFYTQLLKDLVLVAFRGGLKPHDASLDGYLGLQGQTFPRIRSASKLPGEILVEFLEKSKDTVASGPVFDSVSITNNLLVVFRANRTRNDYYLESNPDQPIVVYREIPSGIFGFEETVSPECMICCDSVATSLLLPCGHTSTCDTCTRSFRDTKCPICRSKFSSRIFLPIIDTRPPTVR